MSNALVKAMDVFLAFADDYVAIPLDQRGDDLLFLRD